MSGMDRIVVEVGDDYITVYSDQHGMLTTVWGVPVEKVGGSPIVIDDRRQPGQAIAPST